MGLGKYTPYRYLGPFGIGALMSHFLVAGDPETWSLPSESVVQARGSRNEAFFGILGFIGFRG